MLKYLGTDGKTDDTHEEVSRLSPLLVNPIYIHIGHEAFATDWCAERTATTTNTDTEASDRHSDN